MNPSHQRFFFCGGGLCFFFLVATGLVLKFKLKYGSQYGGGAAAQHFSRELKSSQLFIKGSDIPPTHLVAGC